MGLIKKINKPKVLIYDDENIKYIVGDLATFDHEPQVEYYDLMDIKKQFRFVHFVILPLMSQNY